LTPREKGFLLLTSQLGDPNRRPLTVPQLRTLAQRVSGAARTGEDRQLDSRDLTAMGYSLEMAEHIVGLLDDTVLLEHYLRRGERNGCQAISRVSRLYPQVLHNRLGLDAPGCLWSRGDVELMERPAVALVGSRDLGADNLAFAREVGRQAARQGYVLVSGNARGADKAAQESCLAAGGDVIAVVADELERYAPRQHMLYLSEDGFDLPFSAQRALSRNRVIHCMGLRTFVAQSGYQRGGTWDGTVKNLRFGWSTVYCFDDGSPAARLLCEMGANGVNTQELCNFSALTPHIFGLFDQ
jgi:predicted Rossmann fold nucleotide-binding protein DprA/Smf involved in DNA uptake